MPDRAGMILYNARGQVLILQDINSGKWSFPKGKREYGETPFHTAVRECAEESGLQLGVDYVATPTIHMRGGGGIYYSGAVLTEQPSIRVQPREITDWMWINPAAPSIRAEDGNLGVRQFLRRAARSVSPPTKEEVGC